MIREITPNQIANAIRDLLDENQQLKEDNKVLRENYENGIKLLKQNKQLKSVLDEIREYINNTVYYISDIKYLKDSTIGEDLLQILDKVDDLC